MILLYGRSGSGKAVLARRLTDQLGCDRMTVDCGLDKRSIEARLASHAERFLIVDTNLPLRGLVNRAALVIEVRSPDHLIRNSLKLRGWPEVDVLQALAQRYTIQPHLTVDPSTPAGLAQAGDAVLDATGRLALNFE